MKFGPMGSHIEDAETGAMRVFGPKRGLFGYIWATSTHKWAVGEMAKSGNLKKDSQAFPLHAIVTLPV